MRGLQTPETHSERLRERFPPFHLLIPASGEIGSVPAYEADAAGEDTFL
jgi:hypothetical protein